MYFKFLTYRWSLLIYKMGSHKWFYLKSLLNCKKFYQVYSGNENIEVASNKVAGYIK